MKTDFLKGLGITEQSVIDAIMAENGKDINKVKSNTEELETQIADLKTQISDRDGQLKELKASVKDNEELTTKITQLEEANKSSITEYENKISELQKTHAIESMARDFKVKNIKAVTALLDLEKITHANGELKGAKEQFEALAKSDAYLFGESQVEPPAGTKPGNPQGTPGGTPPTSKTLAEAIGKALAK